MTMLAYSQKDPAYSKLRLGTSKLTVGSHGCFVACLATLYQRTPKQIMDIEGAVNSGGYVNSQLVAKACGGSALAPVKPGNEPSLPKGWCVAVTDYYKAAGYPTHFFLVNVEKKLQIDPLDFPAQAEELVYPIVEYRPFSNVKFVPQQTWQQEAQEYAEVNGIIADWTQPEEPMSQVRNAAAFKNFEAYMVKKYGLIPLP